MTTSQPDGEQSIFEKALELTSPEERNRFIQNACGQDIRLKERIELLIQAHEKATRFLPEAPAAQGAPTFRIDTSVVGATEQAGDFIGRYKLLQKIGEGGCGVVYMAEQEEPVRRRVALKIIKLGMDTRSVIARFEAERQALALMDHPNIAKVLDAGATESGRPFFVMELVRGIRITDYCDQNHLPANERLELFMKVCQAVQHAHQKGIIHRDLKPSNILVTINDGVPVPKIIDFGIAKATEQKLTDKTLFTAFEQFIGTPAYMSPEQAVMTSLDIDTRSDIYSLGVLLYELLTGKTPFDPRELLAAGFDEMRRILREVDPARPSILLTNLDLKDATTVANARKTEIPALLKKIQGDLDWIIMKALEKDRTRRYESASAFAEDIKKHLESEPVTARPPTTVYLLQKLVRRHRVAFASAAGIAAALLIGLGLSTWMFLREKEARRRATAAEQQQASLRNLAQKNEQEAQLQAGRNKEVADFAFQLFYDLTAAFRQTENNPLVEEVIDRTVERLPQNLKDQPGTAAIFLHELGGTYSRLQKFAKAESMWREALRLAENALPAEAETASRTALLLGMLQSEMERFSEAEEMLIRGMNWQLKASLAGKETRWPFAFAFRALANVQQHLGKNVEAEKNFRRNLELESERLKRDESQFVNSSFFEAVKLLARHQETMGNQAAAEATFRGAMQLRTNLVTLKVYLHDFLRRAGRFPEATLELKQGLAILEDQLKTSETSDSARAASLRDWAKMFTDLGWDQRSLPDKSGAYVAVKEGERLNREAMNLLRKGTQTRAVVALASNMVGRARIALVATSPDLSLEEKTRILTQVEQEIVPPLKRIADVTVSSSTALFMFSTAEFPQAVETIHRLYQVRDELAPGEKWGALAREWKERSLAITSVKSSWEVAAKKSRAGKNTEAEAIYRELIPVVRKFSDQAPIFLAWILSDFSEVLIKQEKGEEAEPYLLEALDLATRGDLYLHDRMTKEVRKWFSRYENQPQKPERYLLAQTLLSRPGARLEQADHKTACIANLKQIAGATEQWALENRKNQDAKPAGRDLWGLHKYLKVELKCPGGGTYTLGTSKAKPRCSLENEGHKLP